MLETLTKKEPTTASPTPFISIVGHITIDELRQKPRPHRDGERLCKPLSDRLRSPQQEAAARRRRCGPDRPDERTRAAIETARGVERVNLTDGAKQLWCEIYPELSAGQPGLLGAHHGARGSADASGWR